ncbi:putative transcriptional regulator RABBIT EARS-like [Hibiscus syriacus]|uniref:glucan endo-1,3-beta-D-glucosidase n=1 Tax=Hibiscus syriacus TaxID=106335 RepID=A0A6A3BNA5_HIBSY|nr:glucan endo-1,3-beta-glucosidase 12 [Hibiscus syriacus]KAE8718083.1 putative transcriptional regulator RABBIT EARS-like [Hibiscus syriacus]
MASFLFIFLLLSFVTLTSSLPSIGVTYSSASTPPPPDKISTTITSLKISAVRLPDADPSLIKAFAFTNISLFLSIPNPLLPAIAANRSLALAWLYKHVLPFYPRSKITLVSVGNAVLDSVAEEDFTPYLLPAIRNLHLALHELGIKKIPVSTTFSFFSTITTAFPPSSAEFQQPAGDLIVKPLLQFLEETNSSFLINLYPYNLYRLDSEIPVGFALFQDYPFNFRDDLVTGVRYFNLFDMMADAVLTSIAVMGYESIPVIVAETGWPSGGGEAGEVEANEAYAEMYLRGLVRHLKSGVGTPLKKDGVAEVYVYELMDHENAGSDKQRARKWGILSENMTRKYNLEMSDGVKNSGFMAIFLVFITFFIFCGN